MKKTILRLLAAVCAFALCGCVRMRIKLDVDSSGKIKSTMTLLLQEDLLNFNGANMEEQIDSMISEYRKQYPLASVKKAEETEKKYAAVQQEFVSFKIRVQTLNLQPTTLEQDVEMTENAVKEIVKPKPAKQLNFKPANVVKPKNNPVPAKAPTKSTFNNLISKKKSGG